MNLKELKEKLTYDNERNFELLSNAMDVMEEASDWKEEECMELKIMFVRAMCIMSMQSDWMDFDVSELDGKKFILGQGDYSGAPFVLDDAGVKGWQSRFESARQGDVGACMLIAQKLSEGYFSEPMKVNASKFWRIAAEQGDSLAMYNYGMCFRWGEYGEWADPDKALEWFRNAASAGHVKAAEIVKHYDNEEGRSILKQSAISGVKGYGSKWYKSRFMVEQYFAGADEGDAEMQYELARESVPGELFDAFRRKPENAVKYYEMAADQGMLDAMFNLASLYETGCPGMEPDIAKAFLWRKRCAEAGDAEAAYLTAKMYRDGIGCEIDMDACRKYLELAVDGGYKKAGEMLKTLEKEHGEPDITINQMNQNIVDMAYNIVGKISDIDEAIRMVKESYDNIRNDGFLFAKRRLEMILFRLFVLKYYTVENRIGAVDRLLYCMQSGEGAAYRSEVIRSFDGTFDRKLAMEYLKQAAAYHDAGECRKEFEYIMKSAQEGSALSALRLGNLLTEGQICEKDEFSGAFWRWQAAQMGDETAIAALGLCYYSGIGVWQNSMRALYWFALGAAMHLQKACIHNLAVMLQAGIISGAEEYGEEIEGLLDQLEQEDAVDYIKKVGSAVNAMAAEWLEEKEGGL